MKFFCEIKTDNPANTAKAPDIPNNTKLLVLAIHEKYRNEKYAAPENIAVNIASPKIINIGL